MTPACIGRVHGSHDRNFEGSNTNLEDSRRSDQGSPERGFLDFCAFSRSCQLNTKRVEILLDVYVAAHTRAITLAR